MFECLEISPMRVVCMFVTETLKIKVFKSDYKSFFFLSCITIKGDLWSVKSFRLLTY